MKKILTIFAAIVLTIGLLPFAFAEEATVPGGVIVDVPDDEDECKEPEIFIDHTARIWEPNDQTYYTAELYGHTVKNKHGVGGYALDERQNYAFTGETLKYFIIVKDRNGEDDIVGANVLVDGEAVGACAEVDDFEDVGAFKNLNLRKYEKHPDKYKSFICTVIVQEAWDSELEVSVSASDGGEVVCVSYPNTVESGETDLINFNPDLALSLTGGPIDFGEVEAGSSAVSNTIYVGNAAEDGSGVVMDMYIASDDYFTDLENPNAICGIGNGIKYDRFSYYATKGSINSGLNGRAGHVEFGLGTECISMTDEFTPLPSHSGDILDMCRIINIADGASLLTQGSEMSVTFQLDVPEPCVGNFNNGEFHFVGRVV